MIGFSFKPVFQVVFVLILTENVVSLTPIQSNQENRGKAVQKQYFAQDLTELIDKSLSDHSNSSHNIEELKHALSWSPLVYYSTNMLLNNFHEILPALQLLHQLNKNHRLVLSLRYTNESRFLWSRLADVNYDLSENSAVFNNTLIRNHLSAVVLDWQVDKCHANGGTYGMTGSDGKTFSLTSSQVGFYYHPDRYVPVNYLFPNYFKNFFQLHSAYCPECSTIPIGIAYNFQQVKCPQFLPAQVQETDFQTLYLTFRPPSAILLSPSDFQAKISGMLKMNEDFIVKTTAKTNKEKTSKIHLNIVQDKPLNYDRLSWTTHKVLFDFSNRGKYIAEALPNAKSVILPFFNNQYSVKYPRAFKKNIMMWANEKEMDLIFGQAMGHDETVDNFKDEVIVANKKYTIPYLKTNEGSMSLCAVKKNLDEAYNKHERIMVDMDTWRALARFSSKLDESDKDHNCDSVGKPEKRLQTVFMDFPMDTWKIWLTIEDPLEQLIRGYPTISGMRLDTLIFSNIDLKRKKSTIVKFLEEKIITSNISTSSFKYSIGCSMSYVDLVWPAFFKIISGIENATTILTNTMKNTCGINVFQFVEVIVWQVDFDLVIKLSERKVEEIFILRKLFLQQYPGKEVILQLMVKNEENSVIAEIYDAPIVLPAMPME